MSIILIGLTFSLSSCNDFFLIDAVTRFLTASMFENQDRIMTIRPTGYFHKIGCSAEEVDEALKTLQQQ